MDAPYPHTRASVTDDYDYSSDSDLDDEETEAVNSSSEIEDIESADAKGKGVRSSTMSADCSHSTRLLESGERVQIGGRDTTYR